MPSASRVEPPEGLDLGPFVSLQAAELRQIVPVQVHRVGVQAHLEGQSTVGLLLEGGEVDEVYVNRPHGVAPPEVPFCKLSAPSLRREGESPGQHKYGQGAQPFAIHFAFLLHL